MKRIAALAASALVLTGCGLVGGAPAPAPTTVTETVEPTPTVTVTEAPEPTEPSVIEEWPEEEPEGPSGADVMTYFLDQEWDAMSASEQDDMCWGWNFDKETLTDAFFEGGGGDFSEYGITRDDVIAYFDGKCL